MPPFQKGEKITDPVILERLKKAREKAMEVRKYKKQQKEDEKLVKTLEAKKKHAETKNKIDELTSPQPEQEVIVVKTKQKKKVVYVKPESDSDRDSDVDVPTASKPSVDAPPTPTPEEPAVPKRGLSKFDRLFHATYGHRMSMNY